MKTLNLKHRKRHKQKDLAKIVGIIDAICCCLWLIDALSGVNRGVGQVAVLVIVFSAISFVLATQLSKSWTASVLMIIWGITRKGVIRILLPMIDVIYYGELTDYRVSTYRHLVGDTNLPLIAGLLGIMALCFFKKRDALPSDDEKRIIWEERLACYSTFALITVFYLELFAMLSLNAYTALTDSRFFLEVINDVLRNHVVGGIYEVGFSCWIFAMLPTYLIYFGAHNPFSAKRKASLIAAGIVGTLITSILSIYQIWNESDGFAASFNSRGLLGQPWFYSALIVASAVILIGGYLWYCKKKNPSPYSYALIAFGFPLFAPLLIIVVLLVVSYCIIQLFRTGESRSNGKEIEVEDENGERHTLTHYADDTYKDEDGNYWTDRGDSTFRRD